MTAYSVVLLFLYNLLFASKIMLQPLHLKCTVLRSAKSLSRLISKLVKQSTVCRWRHSKELLCHFQKSFYLQQTSFSLALKFSKLILLTFHTTSSLFSNLDLISKYSTIFKSVTLSKCLSSKNNQILDLRNHRIQSYSRNWCCYSRLLYCHHKINYFLRFINRNKNLNRIKVFFYYVSFSFMLLQLMSSHAR